MTTPSQEVDMMYVALKPPAVDTAHQYILSRTPERLQTLMLAKIDADLNPPPDPTHAVIANGAAVPIQYSGGQVVQGSPAIATVAGGTLTFAKLSVAQAAMVRNADNVVVHNAAGANQAGSPAAAEVAGQVLTDVKLTV